MPYIAFLSVPYITFLFLSIDVCLNRQKETQLQCVVRPQHKINFHWADHEKDRELSLRLVDDGREGSAQGSEKEDCCQTAWSGGIDISALGETHVRLRTPSREDAGKEKTTIVR